MGLKKGQTNNLHGRPKGSKNKVTGSLRLALEDVLRDEIGMLPELLENLDPKDRVQSILKITGQVLPRLNSIDENHSTNQYLIKEEEDVFALIQKHIEKQGIIL